MKSLKIAIGVLYFLLHTSYFLSAQIAINTDGTSPDTSAILDVSSTDKGILIPRMDSTNRNNIINPAIGLLVYDSTTTSFWYYDTQWNEIQNGTTLQEDILENDVALDFDCMAIAGSLGIGGTPRSIALSGDYAYVVDASSDDLKIIDISNPTTPTLLGSIGVGGLPYAVVISGNYAYVVDYASNDLKIINISDPTLPTLVSSIGLSSWSSDIKVSGNYAYVIVNNSTLKIIDISNPISPSVVSSLAGFSDAGYLSTYGNYLYLVGNKLYVIDISDPTNPVTLGYSSQTFQAASTRIASTENYVYITDIDNGNLNIFDVSTPSNPTLISTLTLRGSVLTFPFDITIVNDYAYITDAETDDLKIINISNPANPTITQSISIGFYPTGIKILGNYAYIIDSGSDDIKAVKLTCDAIVGINPLSGEYSSMILDSIQDNLGDHTATENIQLSDNWLSNDGDSEGLNIDDDGNVNINQQLSVTDTVTLSNALIVNGQDLANPVFTSDNGITKSNNNSDDFLFGADSLNYGGNGTEIKMFFDRSKRAFRAGSITNSYWDEDNIGFNSFSIGDNTQASGAYSAVLGSGTASGTFSTVFSQGTASGDFSIAFGGSVASGDYSTAICSSSASGSFSTAFGSSYANGSFSTSFSRSSANGDYSTSFGLGSRATSYGEVTIGMYNIEDTTGNSSSFINTDRLFVIGNGTADAARSDAMIVYKNGNTEINGDLTISGDISVNNLAFTTASGITKANNNSDDFVFGTNNLDWSGGTETKFFFDNAQAAFRAGEVLGTYWDAANVGAYSVSFGKDNTASGYTAMTWGQSNTASAYYAAAWGYANTASGNYTTTWGESNTASGTYATAFGKDNIASGQYAIAFGRGSEAPSYAETVLGTYATTYLPNSTNTYDSDDRLLVIGNGTADANRSDALIIYKSGNMEINGDLTVSGSISGLAFNSENGVTASTNNENDFVFGADSLKHGSGTESKLFFDKSKGAFRAGIVDNDSWDESNIGDYSFAGGFNSKANGDYSTAFSNGDASGDYSTAFSNGDASGNYSTAFSLGEASGEYSTAFNINTVASGDRSTAFSNGIASGEYSTAFSNGYSTGDYSTAFSQANATGDYSTAFGLESQAYSYNEYTIGTYNTTYTPNNTTGFDSADRLFVIGNGTANNSRSDAMIVYKNGNTEINGDLTVSGTISGLAFNSENGVTASQNNNDDFVFGADSLNWTSGTESKLFFDKSKGAFRAGIVDNDSWDESSIGDYSFAGGKWSNASGDHSTAFGSGDAIANYATAFSKGDAEALYATAFSQGSAYGNYSIAFSQSYATGNHSTAFSGSNANGDYSTAFSGSNANGGYSNSFSSATANGDYSTAFGLGSYAYSYNEFAIGTYNTTYAGNSTNSFDSTDRLFVIGNGTSAARSDAMIVYKDGTVSIGTDATTETLNVGNDMSVSAIIGKVQIGNIGHSSSMGFAHIDQANSSSYALLQGSDGRTFLNAASGQDINFHINNTSKMKLDANGDLELGNNSDVAAIIGRAKIGYNGNNSDFASFAHIDHSSNTNYAMMQDDGGRTLINAATGEAIEFRNNNSTKMSLTSDGYLGIGKVPTNAKFEVDGYVTYTNLAARYYNLSGTLGTNTTDRDLSAYFSDHIACEELQVFSDKRMKNVLGLSSSKEDLNRLMQIEITNYQMKDTISEGSDIIKKVIAQQVKEVYPEAVSNNITRVIPDIYQLCSIENGWITLNDELLMRNDELKVGDKVQLILEDRKELVEVLETKKGAFRVNINQEKEVFVFGREVKDFHTVDYEAIAMLNVSATQELAKENEQLKSQVRNAVLEINELKVQVKTLNKQQAEIAELKAMLQTIQTQQATTLNNTEK